MAKIKIYNLSFQIEKNITIPTRPTLCYFFILHEIGEYFFPDFLVLRKINQMRQKLLHTGTKELSYEIRGIVKKAESIQKLGGSIIWENIGDPVQKQNQLPMWIRETIAELSMQNETYGYCHSKGILETREFLANLNNKRGGSKITSEDILFFNGAGDAISKLYRFIVPTSRVIVPSPAYSTHSSTEAAHANQQPLTFQLNPDDNWYPNLDDLYNKIKYNPSIVGILIINPDNPTGMIYPKPILNSIVNIAREFNLFLVSDEIYMNITYNGARFHSLAEVIGDVPGMAIKGISKEFPWPGGRCAWVEYYNRRNDQEFNKWCGILDNTKMVEVCSTKLPQVAIPRIMGDSRYLSYRLKENKKIGHRSKLITQILKPVPYIMFNETFGAFYNTIIFKEGALKEGQKMKINNPKMKALVDEWLTDKNMPLDKCFVYYLLASKGVCVVPVSSFCSDLKGFRITLLEEDEELLKKTAMLIKEGIMEYCES